MNFKYLVSSIAAAALLMTGCVKEQIGGDLDQIKFEKTIMELPNTPGEVSVKMTATEAWEFNAESVLDDPETGDPWLSVSPASGAAGDFETIAFVNAKPARDFYGRYSAISKYVSAAKEAARSRGYAVCDIWLHEKNFTPAKFEKLAAARGIRGGIVFGHYYRDSVPAEFRGAMGKLKLVSMGVKSNAPVKSSVFMDRFLMVRGFVERIMRGGYGRAGFIVERFADKCEDGKFTGGFFAAQFGLVVNHTHYRPANRKLFGSVVYDFDLDFLTLHVAAGFDFFVGIGISVYRFGYYLFSNPLHFLRSCVSGFDFSVPQQVGDLSAKQRLTLVGGSAEFSLNCHMENHEPNE